MPTHVAGETAQVPMKKREKVKKELDHVRIYKAENGGHVIEHHFTSFEHEPEKHVFSAEEGPEAHDHLEEHMGMKQAEVPKDEEESEEENEKD